MVLVTFPSAYGSHHEPVNTTNNIFQKIMLRTLIPAIALVALAFSGRAVQPEPVAETDGHTQLVQDHQFIGATRCRTCHRKEEDGAQFDKWAASAHAEAFNVLATDEAKAIAAEKGIDDPQAADECLKCHVTGHGAPAEMLGAKYDMAEGVTCESCHGAGGDYYKKSTMEGIASGEIDGATVGYMVPDVETCTACHNDTSPTYKEFDYDTQVAKIAHPNPNK